MTSSEAQRRALHIALWYGVSFVVFVITTLLERPMTGLMARSALGLLLALGGAVTLDQARLHARKTRGLRYALDQAGIADLMSEVGPVVRLCAEEDLEPVLVEYDELATGGATPLDTDLVREAVEGLQTSHVHAKLALDPSLKLSIYLEAATLPQLPQVEGRDQLGLFATQRIPAQRLFLWESDLGVARSGARAQLPSAVRMNRRTLHTHGGLEVFQGGGEEQRSNASILANFYWCHSESMPRTKGRYLIYPPHYFGSPNCEYVTTLNAYGTPCSALKTLREIDPGEQLLMYTGSTQSALTIQLRVGVAWLISLLAPAGSLLPWVWLWR